MASSAYLDWVLKRENKAPRRPQASGAAQEPDADTTKATTVPIHRLQVPEVLATTLHKSSARADSSSSSSNSNAQTTIAAAPSEKAEAVNTYPLDTRKVNTEKSPIVRKRKLSELLGRSPAAQKQQPPASPPTDLDFLPAKLVEPTDAASASGKDYPMDAVAPFDFDANAEALERAVKKYRITPSDSEMELSFQSPVRPKRETSAAATSPRTPLMQDVQYWKAVERFADMD